MLAQGGLEGLQEHKQNTYFTFSIAEQIVCGFGLGCNHSLNAESQKYHEKTTNLEDRSKEKRQGGDLSPPCRIFEETIENTLRKLNA